MKWKLTKMLTDLYDREIPQFYDEENEEFKPQDKILTEKTFTKFNEGTFLMREVGSSQGITLQAGEKWESEIFDVRGLDKLLFRLSLSRSATYQVTIEQLVQDFGGIISNDKNIVVPQRKMGSFEGRFNLTAPYFRIVIESFDSDEFKIGTFLYAK